MKPRNHAEQVAMTQQGRGNRVAIWAEVTERHANGDFDFWVINGFWDGQYRAATRQIRVCQTGRWYDAKIVWAGKAPFRESRYNEAIAWIEDQIKGNALVRAWKRLKLFSRKLWANRYLRPRVVWVDTNPTKEEVYDEIPY